MEQDLSYRKAVISDLKSIIRLLHDDNLGKTREDLESGSFQRYRHAFTAINNDPNQYLMVVESGSKVVGTCHLTVMPSLTFTGSLRLQIEAVRVKEEYRSQNIGEWMINQAIEYGRKNGASIIQLTTDRNRPRARQFYMRIGFADSHSGMKIHI
jgi:ribosomal protein S18 acetylase RimI-like enzyme